MIKGEAPPEPMIGRTLPEAGCFLPSRGGLLTQRGAEDTKNVEWRGRDGDPSPSELSAGEEKC
jgi:hypothetical protein